MKRVWWPAAVYAAAHFAVDLGCAFAVFSFCDGGSLGFLPAYLGAESIPESPWP